MRLLLGTAVTLAGTSIAAVPALGVPSAAGEDLASVLEQAREASGVEAWSSRGLEIVLRGGGQDQGLDHQGRVVFDATGRYVEEKTGRLGSTDGWDGQTSWNVDWAGTPSVRNAAQAASEQLRQWLRSHFWSSPDAPLELELARSDDDHHDIVLRSTAAHDAATVTLDRVTSLPIQLQWGRGDQASVVHLSDYREVSGLMVAHCVVTTGRGAFESRFQAEDASSRPARADSYAPRIGLPEDFSFEEESSLGLESMRTRSGHTLVRAELEGEDVGWFVLDSGAGINCIDPAVADELGLDRFGSVMLSGVGGSKPTTFSRPAYLGVGPFDWDDPIFVDMDCEFMTRAFGVKIAGVVGFGLFSRAVVSIDLREETVRLDHPATFELPRGQWQPLCIVDRQPCVECSFEGNRRGLFKIDTGAGGSTLTIHAPAVEEYALLEGRETSPSVVGGFGGSRPARIGVLDYFELGGRRFDDLQVTFATEAVGAFGGSSALGNIGAQLLEPFEVVFDYANRRIALLER